MKIMVREELKSESDGVEVVTVEGVPGLSVVRGAFRNNRPYFRDSLPNTPRRAVEIIETEVPGLVTVKGAFQSPPYFKRKK